MILSENEFLDDDDTTMAEVTLWRKKWTDGKREKMPYCAILATIPVTTANNESVFSNLRYMKLYLWSTMCQPRLNGLMMLFVYDDAELCVEKLFSLDMQSRASASCGGMHHKRAYIDPILPTHNPTMQTNPHFHNNVRILSILLDYISIASEWPNFCTLTIILRPISTAWSQQFTIWYALSTVWSRKSLTSYDSLHFVESKLFPSTLNKFPDIDM
uniref:HAT C-terminal dimerisation domain-containing protein n=1 Tax=Romanomermis culicivorax TaxID=13658 RepID=A0A915J5Z6_ROMCU